MCTNPKSVNHWHTKSTACVKKKKEGKKGHHYTQARTTFCCTTIIHVFFQMPSQSWLVSNRISTSCQPQNSHLRMNTITKSIHSKLDEHHRKINTHSILFLCRNHKQVQRSIMNVFFLISHWFRTWSGRQANSRPFIHCPLQQAAAA